MLEQMEPPLLDLRAATWISAGKFEVRDDAKKFETWEAAAAPRLGLGVAIEYALALGLDWIEYQVQHLAGLLRQRLAEVKGVTVQDLGRQRCGIVTFTYERHPAGEVMHWLQANGIAVRVIERSSTRIDMERRGLDQLVRASVHYYNTEAELERLCSALRAMND
jgi:selenocysteine lyase/cysteine desulfurase